MWRSPYVRASLLLTVALVSAGCLPSIGDECRVDLDCSQLGDRVCDTSQPAGYCTQFNCDPTSCPEDESICIAYATALSSVDGCQDPNRLTPFERTFCMKACTKDKECRPGYECIDVAGDDPWGAEVIQSNPRTTKVCAIPSSAALPPVDLLSDLPENVCTGPSPSGEGGAAGNGGAGGASNP